MKATIFCNVSSSWHGYQTEAHSSVQPRISLLIDVKIISMISNAVKHDILRKEGSSARSKAVSKGYSLSYTDLMSSRYGKPETPML